jgi:hypothetical protein
MDSEANIPMAAFMAMLLWILITFGFTMDLRSRVEKLEMSQEYHRHNVTLEFKQWECRYFGETKEDPSTCMQWTKKVQE